MPSPESKLQIYNVWSDAIERRLDPMYFHPARLAAIEAIRKAKAKLEPLSEVAEFRRELVTEIPEDAPYLGLENIASNTGEYVGNGDKDSISSAFVFKKGDVLFPKLRPYLNKVHFAEFDGVCSTEFHVLKAVKCLPEYLFVFLSTSVVVAQTSRLMTGNTLPRLQTEDIEELLVPLPTEGQQKKVISLMWDARAKKRKMEEEVQKVLSSIDSYVLGELGITEIGGGKTGNEQKTFEVWSDEIGGRLDASFYNPHLLGLLNSINSTTHAALGDAIADMSGGATPRVADDYYAEDGIPFLRVQNITEMGLNLDDVKYIKQDVHENMLQRSQLKKDDLVFTITGRVGSVAVVPQGFVGNINQHSVRIHLKNTVDGIILLPEYVAAFFNTQIGRKLSLRYTTGGTRPALDYVSLKKLVFPLPAETVQRKIITGVCSLYEKVRALRQEAGAIIAAAQQKAEETFLA